MVARGDKYSRTIFWLKILMPVGALAILMTTFMYKTDNYQASRIWPSSDGVARVEVSGTVGRPRFSGLTGNGSSLTIIAESYVPEEADPSRALAEDVTATYSTSPRGEATLRAATAYLDRQNNVIFFDGNVRVNTSSREEILASHMEVALDSTYLLATGGVKAISPVGQTSSASLEITSDPEVRGSYVLEFAGDVDIVLPPPDPARNYSTSPQLMSDAAAEKSRSPGTTRPQVDSLDADSRVIHSPILAAADRVTVNHNKGSAILTGHVVVTRDNYEMTAPWVQIDYAIDPGTQEREIRSVHGTGGVVIADGLQSVKGDDAIYYHSNRKAIMTGNVRAILLPKVGTRSGSEAE